MMRSYSLLYIYHLHYLTLRTVYISQADRDTYYCIHSKEQPEWTGYLSFYDKAISSEVHLVDTFLLLSYNNLTKTV